jgi:hypothetical protein
MHHSLILIPRLIYKHSRAMGVSMTTVKPQHCSDSNDDMTSLLVPLFTLHIIRLNGIYTVVKL